MTQREETQMRCPAGPRRMLAILRASGQKPTYVDDGILVEFACSDCSRELRRAGRDVARVLHRFNILGEFVESEIVERD